MILKYNGDAFDQVFEKIDDLRRLSNYFKVSDKKMTLVVSFSMGVIHFSPLAVF